MKKITQNFRWLVTLLAMIVCTGAWAEEPTGTITFGTNATKINSASVTGEDNQGNEWTITTEGTTSYTANADYYQVGSSKSPATSITFTTTLPSSRTIKSMSAKFGGFNGTEGTVTMKVGDTTIGEGSLNGTSDVTVNSAYEATGTVLTVTVTGIAKGVKCYYISYTYNGGGTPTPTVPSITVDPAIVNATAEGADGTLAISYENLNISSTADFGIQYYDDNNEVIEEPDWIVTEVESEEAGVSYMISYVVDANQGEARTAYLKVYGLDAEANDVYSGLITINQAAYVAPSTPVKYELVTDVNQLEDGQEYIIVGKNNDTYYAMSAQKNNNRGAVEISVSENIATISSSEVQVITLEEDNDGWNFYTGELGYLYAAASNNNYLRTETTPDENGNAKATIVISSDGDATIVFQGNYTRNNLRFNNSNTIFSCYASTSNMPLVQLYKKVEAETAPSVTIGAANWATYVAEANVTFPTGVSAYTVETINTDHVTLGVVSAVKEGTPILVYSETPGTYTLEVVAEEDFDESYDTSNNKLRVSNGDVTGNGSIYVLAQPEGKKTGFYPLASDVTVPAGKAYLDTSSAKNLVKGFLALGGLADAINNIAVETANGTIFNIAGQKVQNITKGGLYIVNGKKVFVK